MKFKKLISFLLVLSIAATFAVGCKKDPSESETSSESQTESPIESESESESGSHPIPTPPIADVKVALSCDVTEIKSGSSATFNAVVTGLNDGEDDGVSWTITEGSEFASINANGVLTASEVDGDKIVKIRATSAARGDVYGEKTMTIVAKSKLTQSMLDAVAKDTAAFVGYMQLDVYDTKLGDKDKLNSTYYTSVKTAMDGEKWYAEYDNASVGITQGLYVKKVREDNVDYAMEVGVSLKNEERYYSVNNDLGEKLTWAESGYYNNFKGLRVSDFTFNAENWRWEYSGADARLKNRMTSSANPYDFEPQNLQLLIDDGEIMGFYSLGADDYAIVSGYITVPKLFVAIDVSENVSVSSVGRYKDAEEYAEGSDERAALLALRSAKEKMKTLERYNTRLINIQYSNVAQTMSYTGYDETITPDALYYRPFSVLKYGAEDQQIVYDRNSDYGYRNVRNGLYNMFNENIPDGIGNVDENQKTYSASRAYTGSVNDVRPSFDFSEAIFTQFAKEKDSDGADTGYYIFYSDSIMSQVATTFYRGVGNDISLYGILATEGQLANNVSFTPYVRVSPDGYITESGFYYVISIYFVGVVEITYSDFNDEAKATLSSETQADLSSVATREVPTSWNEVSIITNSDTGATQVADEYFNFYFGIDGISDEIPFLGVTECIGDTFGLGMGQYCKGSDGRQKKAITLYYDVPLDLDYTIDSSLKSIDEYLVKSGFVANLFGEYEKTVGAKKIVVKPVDSSLDLFVYIWVDEKN